MGTLCGLVFEWLRYVLFISGFLCCNYVGPGACTTYLTLQSLLMYIMIRTAFFASIIGITKSFKRNPHTKVIDPQHSQLPTCGCPTFQSWCRGEITTSHG